MIATRSNRTGSDIWSERSHIYLFDIAFRQLDTLTTGDFDDSAPTWSPDGNLIAFVSKREGNDPDRTHNADIYVVEARKAVCSAG